VRLLPLKNKTRSLKLLTVTKMFGSFDDNLYGFEKTLTKVLKLPARLTTLTKRKKT